MPTLPSGTVTYLMTDVVGSTAMWEANPEAMAVALQRHDEIAERCIREHNGHLVKSRGEGDSLFSVFSDPADAVRASLALQLLISDEPWPSEATIHLRVALHTGSSEIRGSDYYGPPVNRCARVRATARAGQILLTQATHHLVQDKLPSRSSLFDLGTHRLRDLLRPERLSELRHPSLLEITMPLDSLNKIQHNLPVQLTSFVGRPSDEQKVRQLLSTSRLVTLMGSGGCGKTRLALQVGGEAGEEYPDGIWFVDLTKIGEGQAIADLISKTLHLLPRPSKDTVDQLVDAFQERRVLLILDNCEHVIDGAAELVDQLLERCQYLVVLATSREALRVTGEARWRVPSLGLPRIGDSFEEIVSADAIRLFVERASLRSPGFAVTKKNVNDIATLCRLLDGIPLAIEQAASNTSLFSPQQLVSRFTNTLNVLGTTDRGVVPRHRTLQATIEWSYEMLPDSEKLLLQRCSVFPGGWSIDAAESTCAQGEIKVNDVAWGLNSLFEKSLIYQEEAQGDTRFRLLQTIAEFARGKLDDSGQTAARFAAYYVGRASALAAKSDFDTCEAEIENICSALDSLALSEPKTTLDAMIDLRFFWLSRGHFRFADRVISSLVEQCEDKSVRARSYNILGALRYRTGEFRRAKEALQQSIALWANLDEPQQEAGCLINLGLVTAMLGEFDSAAPLFDRAHSIYQDIGDVGGQGKALANIGRLLIDAKNFAGSIEKSEMAIPLLRRSGEETIEGATWANIALAAALVGDRLRSIRAVRESLAKLEKAQDADAVLVSLAVLCNLCRTMNESELCQRTAAQARSFAMQMDLSISPLIAEIMGETSRPDSGPTVFESFDIVLDQAFSICDILESANS